MIGQLDNHPFILALSHDVDRVAKRWQFLFYALLALREWRSDSIAQQVRSLQALLRGDEPYWNFPRIVHLEEELAVRSTFFFLNETGRASWRNPRSFMLFWGRYDIESSPISAIIQKLDARGWEIGLHGSYNSYDNARLLSQEKQTLEALVGHEIAGSRQHYLNLNVPETWRLQAQVGLQYDSSLGYSDRIGHRWNICRPFYPRDPVTGERLPVLQIPLGIMDGPLMRRPDPWTAALHMIETVEANGGVLTLDWHQRVFNPWEYQAYQDMYVRIIRECQQRGAWVTTLGEVANWWQGQACQ